MAEQQSRSAHFQGLVYAAVISGVLYAIARVLEVRFSVPYQVLLMLAAAFGYLLFRRYDLAVPWNPGRRGSVGTRLLWSWALFVAGLMFVGYITKYSAYFSRELLLGWIFITPAMIFVVHLLVRLVLRRWMPHMSTTRSCVLVFANESARLLAENLVKSSTYDIKGYFDDREPERTGGGVEGIPFLGKARKVVEYVKEHGIQVVFVVLPSDGVRRAVNVLDELGDTTASMYYVPDFFVFNLMQAQVSEIEGVPVIEVAETPFYGVDGLFKQIFDVIVSSIILLLISPVMLIVALAVKLSSKGPVFFKQSRYGLNGQEIQVYKFRSMYVGDAKQRELQQATRDDPRITPVGRFIRRTSLDELPQFINVLLGDMSICGPRPHSVSHNEQYRKAVKRYMVRHKVKPGITGWAQVHGLRGETAQIERMEERIKYDLEYIRNWSPLLDVRIILMTVSLVFRDSNAY